MSGVLRRGSLSFNCILGEKGSRGGSEYNLHGEGFHDAQLSRTPEISVLALDFKRLSQDLKKDFSPTPSSGTEIVEVYDGLDGDTKDLSQDVDSDVISNFIGHFRRWQLVWTLTLSFFQIPSTFHMFGFVFQTADKDFWCARPADLAHLDVSAWRNLTQTHDACSLVDLTASDNNSAEACTQFEYSMDEGDGLTLVQEFDLVCDRQNLLSVVEMCFLAGAAVGSVSSGWLSDVFGRKHTLMGFALVQAVFGIVLTFSTSLAMFMTLRVIVGFASMTVVVVSFVLVVELVSGKWRTIIGILNILPVALAYILIAGIAYFVRDWRHLQVVISLPGWALLSIWYKLPESPRWLLARGRLNELYVLIERAARMNGTILPANYQKSLEAAGTKVTPVATPAAAVVATERTDTTQPTQPPTTTTPATDSNKPEIDSDANPLVVVFNKQYWSTTCLTLIVWLTLIVIYFGLTLHLSNLGGNIYVNTVIAGSAEALSICLSIFVVLRLGIRRSLIAYMLIPGVCCLATNLVPKDNPVAVIALAMIAKCMIGANNAIIPTYTAMQYPTVVRNFGVGMGNLAAGVALILVPYMWLLAQVQPLLPLSVMGVCGIVGAVALMMMKDVK